MSDVPEIFVCVCGGPRSGTNIVAAVIHSLGFPARRNAWRERDQMMQSGSYHDQAFVKGQVVRRAPWVFKCHGFKYQHQVERFLRMKNLVVVHTRRDLKQVINSLKWCASLNDAGALKHGEVQTNKPQEKIAGWKTMRADYFADAFPGPKIDVDFAELIGEPNSTVEKIARFVGVSVTDKSRKLVRPSVSRFST